MIINEINRVAKMIRASLPVAEFEALVAEYKNSESLEALKEIASKVKHLLQAPIKELIERAGLDVVRDKVTVQFLPWVVRDTGETKHSLECTFSYWFVSAHEEGNSTDPRIVVSLIWPDGASVSVKVRSAELSLVDKPMAGYEDTPRKKWKIVELRDLESVLSPEKMEKAQRFEAQVNKRYDPNQGPKKNYR